VVPDALRCWTPLDLPPTGTLTVGEPSKARRTADGRGDVHVGHINCGSCERTIRTLLGDVDGVKQVTADHRTNTVAVTYDEQRISRDAVVGELTEIGYAPKEA